MEKMKWKGVLENESHDVLNAFLATTRISDQLCKTLLVNSLM